MHHRLSILLSSLIIVFLLFGCESNGLTFKNYVDTKNNFSINYPNNWSVKSDDNGVQFLSARENMQDLPLENIYIQKVELPFEANKPIEEYKEEIVKSMVEKSPNLQIESTNSRKVNIYPALEVVVKGNVNGHDYKVNTIYILNKKSAYVLGVSVPMSNEKQYWDVFNQMLTSFTIVDSK